MLETPPLYAYYRYRKIIWETGFSMCALPVERSRGNQAPSQAVRVATASTQAVVRFPLYHDYSKDFLQLGFLP